MTTTTAPAPADVKRPRMPFAERVRLHPHSGDRFTAAGRFTTFCFEVEFLSNPWVFYKKWPEGCPARTEPFKVHLGKWRANLATAEIKEMP
jgi:hypothetical protein